MNKKNLGFLLLLIVSFGYGVMPSFTQKCYELGMSVETLLATRSIIGTGLIWLFILITKRDINALKVGKKNFLFLEFVGFISFVSIVCMATCYLYIPGAIASIIIFLYVVIVNVIEILIGKEQLYSSRVFCLILTMLGIVAVVYVPSGGTGFNIKGLLLAFGAGFLYAFWAMGMGSNKVKDFSAEVVMGYMMIAPTVCNIIRCLLAGQPLFPEHAEQWVFMSFLCLFPGFLCPVLYCAAVKILGASTAAMVNTIEPVIAYFAGILIMSDIISWNATLGGVMIVLGILFLNISERRREAKQASELPNGPSDKKSNTDL